MTLFMLMSMHWKYCGCMYCTVLYVIKLDMKLAIKSMEFFENIGLLLYVVGFKISG